MPVPARLVDRAGHDCNVNDQRGPGVQLDAAMVPTEREERDRLHPPLDPTGRDLGVGCANTRRRAVHVGD